MPETRPADALDHVLRPRLPWRQEDLTECGRDPANLPTITRDDLINRVRKLGQQRTVFTVCMTCWHRSAYSKPWADEPEAVLEREIQRRKPQRLRHELTAITLLIDAHRDEFNELLNGLAGTPSLADHRRNRRTKGGSRG